VNHLPDTRQRTAQPVFEIDGRRFTAGDRVQFPRAGMRQNRRRIYEITETTAESIQVSVDGCSYRLGRDSADSLGIVHAEEK